MRRSRFLPLIVLGITFYSVITCRAIGSSSYTFTEIAPVQGQYVTASINNNGQVVFVGAPLGGAPGVYLGQGHQLTTVATTADPRFLQFYDAAINNSGTVVFGAGVSSVQNNGVFTWTNGALTPIAVVGAGYSGVSGIAAINSHGTVAFNAISNTLGSGVFTSTNGAVTVIAASGAITGSGSDLSLNNFGTVAFEANPVSGGNSIVTGNGGPLTTVATTGTTYSQVGESPATNDAGTALFDAVDSKQSLRLYRETGGAISKIGDQTGLVDNIANEAINNTGELAFLGGDVVRNSFAIFTGTDAINNEVITSGDPLLGKTVENVWFTPKGLNDNGSLAFWAQLSDGTSAIFRADPTPEPGTAIPCLIGIGLATLRRKKICSECVPTGG